MTRAVFMPLPSGRPVADGTIKLQVHRMNRTLWFSIFLSLSFFHHFFFFCANNYSLLVSKWWVQWNMSASSTHSCLHSFVRCSGDEEGGQLPFQASLAPRFARHFFFLLSYIFVCCQTGNRNIINRFNHQVHCTVVSYHPPASNVSSNVNKTCTHGLSGDRTMFFLSVSNDFVRSFTDWFLAWRFKRNSRIASHRCRSDIFPRTILVFRIECTIKNFMICEKWAILVWFFCSHARALTCTRTGRLCAAGSTNCHHICRTSSKSSRSKN